MKFNKKLTRLIRKGENNKMTAVAIISGIAIGAAIAALFATKPGKAMKGKWVNIAANLLHQLSSNTPAKAKAKLGSIIADVRSHVKQNAEGLTH